ncbi:MAG: hypothetical protein JXX14_16265 [Deltaproteobacteria bacterium]|nr:hypothetical protein [Deltaproteobacteria bacterium]
MPKIRPLIIMATLLFTLAAGCSSKSASDATVDSGSENGAKSDDTVTSTETGDTLGTAPGSDTASGSGYRPLDTATTSGGDTGTQADTAATDSASVEDIASDTDSASAVDTDTNAASDSDGDAAGHSCSPQTIPLAGMSGDYAFWGSDDAFLYFRNAGLGDSELLQVNKQTGAIQSLEAALPHTYPEMAVEGDILYVYEVDSADPTSVYRLDKYTGAAVGEPVMLPPLLTTMQVNGGELFSTYRNTSGLQSLNPESGEVTTWTTAPVDSFKVTSDWVYWVDSGSAANHRLVRRPRSGGELSQELVSGPVSSVSTFGDCVYLKSIGGTVEWLYRNSQIVDAAGYIWLEPDNPGDAFGVAPYYDIYSENDDPMVPAGDALYISNRYGEFWQFPLSISDSAPTPIEITGNWDSAFREWIAVDDQAVYWQAGTTAGELTFSNQPGTVYKTCHRFGQPPQSALHPALEALKGGSYHMTISEIASPVDSAGWPLLMDPQYSAVDDGDTYSVSFSEQWHTVQISGVALANETIVAEKFRFTPDLVTYVATQGLPTGGYFMVSVQGEQLFAELVINGPRGLKQESHKGILSAK